MDFRIESTKIQRIFIDLTKQNDQNQTYNKFII